MKKLLFLILLLLTAGCAKPVTNQTVTLPDAPQERSFPKYIVSSGDVISAVYLFENTKDYTLQAGDLVDIQFPLQPELNVQQRIRPDGMITLPYVDDSKIAGLSPQQAGETLTRQYSGIMRQPNVKFLVIESNSELATLKNIFSTSNSGQSKSILVRPDGQITLPGIGDIQAAGRTFPDLSTTVNNRYQRRWPEVSVNLILEKATPPKVYVLGEVEKDGEFKITSPLTIPQALALAGGRTDKANTDTVYIARRQGQEYICNAYKLDDSFITKNGTVPFLSANDILYVPKSGLSAAAEVMLELSQVILFKGWGFQFNYGLNEDWNWGF